MRTAVLLVVAACCVAAAAAIRGPLEPEEIPGYTFDRFVEEFNRPWAAGSTEYATRQALFESRREEIVAHNNAGRSWTRTINKYADWTEEERKSLLGYRHPDPQGEHTKYAFPYTPSGIAPAPSRDWKQYLTGIKDQGQCGSCYAHSATESVETYVAMTTGKYPVLSQQQAADCTINPNDCGGNGGCGGGTAKISMASFAQHGGVANVWTYPYTLFWGGATPLCRYNDTNAGPTGTPAVAAIDGYVEVGQNNFTETMDAIANVGPLSIAVMASNWPDYHSGVYDGCGDDSWIMDHAVQMVGYGVDSDSGLPYWTVRNSWGVDFGEEGFIRVRRHLNTPADPVPCGMDTNPSAGSGCNNGPPAVKVCGSCGILYSPSFPKNARAL